MKTPYSHKVVLLFTHRYIYGREVIAGIASYLRTNRASWTVFLPDDFDDQLNTIKTMDCDGIIADYDNPEFRAIIKDAKVPVVAVGTSYESEQDYPLNLPFVCTDNAGLVRAAYEHLIKAGLTHFAMLSLNEGHPWDWAREREKAFTHLVQAHGLPLHIYHSVTPDDQHWDESLNHMIVWLQSLPKPVGVIAVNDRRARKLLQACSQAGISVPDQVAVIGIDNDPIGRSLGRISLSSVSQNTEEMGRIAARMLHQRLGGVQHRERVIVGPGKVNEFASTELERLNDPKVIQARFFIRQYARQGIRTQQVADYVEVSRSTLETLFKNELGRSVHDEILRFKLESAKMLLAEGECSILQVALTCGFTSISYMHSVFKRELGCTPRAYKDSLRGSGVTFADK